MPDVDPAHNGDMRFHGAAGREPGRSGRGGRARPPTRAPIDPARRGRWVVTVAVVSATTGAFLLLGFAIAGTLRHYAGIPVGVLFVFVVGCAVGGVWTGAWLCGRLTGGNRRRYVATGIGGCVGLVVAIALGYASLKLLPDILPLAAILSPGGVAAVAANAAEREERPPPEP